MTNWKKTLIAAQAVLYVLCAADGLATMFGAPYTNTQLNLLVGNTLSALFYIPAALALVFSWREWDEDPVRLIRLVSVVVLLGSLLLQCFVFLALSFGAGPWADRVLVTLWVILNLPTINCSILFLPIFGWALLLVSSHTMLRKMHHK